MKFEFSSPAKLNLFLKIKNKRKDGFHNLETIFERINLFDEINIQINNSGKIRVTSDKKISSQKVNLAYKAAELIKKEFSRKEGINIKIKKRIPIGAGLGGASSNAATVLVGLNKIFSLGLNEKQLIYLGKTLGSDVPFFILNTSFAYALGRGEKLTPILRAKNIKFWHILVVPRVKYLTRDMYRRFDDYSRLTNKSKNDTIKCFRVEAIDSYTLKNNLFNSFECVAGQKILRIKQRLSQLGVKYRVMTGSGSAIFGITDSRKEAGRIYRQLKRERLGQVFIVETY